MRGGLGSHIDARARAWRGTCAASAWTFGGEHSSTRMEDEEALRIFLRDAARVPAKFLDKTLMQLEEQEVLNIEGLEVLVSLPLFDACGLSQVTAGLIRRAIAARGDPAAATPSEAFMGEAAGALSGGSNAEAAALVEAASAAAAPAELSPAMSRSPIGSAAVISFAPTAGEAALAHASAEPSAAIDTAKTAQSDDIVEAVGGADEDDVAPTAAPLPPLETSAPEQPPLQDLNSDSDDDEEEEENGGVEEQQRGEPPTKGTTSSAGEAAAPEQAAADAAVVAVAPVAAEAAEPESGPTPHTAPRDDTSEGSARKGKQPAAQSAVQPERHTRRRLNRPLVTKRAPLPASPAEALTFEYRLKVYWLDAGGGGAWYPGSIENMCIDAWGVAKHFVKHDDGQGREFNLSLVRWKQIYDDENDSEVDEEEEVEVDVDMDVEVEKEATKASVPQGRKPCKCVQVDGEALITCTYAEYHKGPHSFELHGVAADIEAWRKRFPAALVLHADPSEALEGLIGRLELIDEPINRRPAYRHADHPNLHLAYTTGCKWMVQPRAQLGLPDGHLQLRDMNSWTPNLSKIQWERQGGSGWIAVNSMRCQLPSDVRVGNAERTQPLPPTSASAQPLPPTSAAASSSAAPPPPPRLLPQPSAASSSAAPPPQPSLWLPLTVPLQS